MSRYNIETMTVYYTYPIISTFAEILHLLRQSCTNLILETDTYININIVYIQEVDGNYIGGLFYK
jgi:hypothetical protein